jgi:UDP-N-acetyl-D-galactosamine dehydrogenase
MSAAKSNNKENRERLAGAKIGVVGLGYVGLPLATRFGALFDTIGYDVSTAKISSYRQRNDPTGEVAEEQFRAAQKLKFTADPSELADTDFFVVAVPTPVDDARLPDFGPLFSACQAIGPIMKSGAIVIFESTVYPGATEDVCIPELERVSGKKWKRDFFVGYSPERINPGDKLHTLRTIVKVVSGDTPATLEKVAALYEAAVDAGVHRATSIKVAEAAKVIENTQRDLNISLMNELAIIFHRMGIDTGEVLDAAGTKWNFLKFKPGLVGGHCIGVDPFYLTHAAEKVGHHPEVILSGRRINDSMGRFVAEETLKCLVAQGTFGKGTKVNVLGLTFKENCPDLRNTKVIDVIHELGTFGMEVTVHDPIADPEEAQSHYAQSLSDWDSLGPADALVLAVSHAQYLEMPLEQLISKVRPGGCVIDIKSALDPSKITQMGLRIWRL